MKIKHLIVIIFLIVTNAMELSELAGDWIITKYHTGSLKTDCLWKGRQLQIKSGWVNMKPVIDKQSSSVLLPEFRQKLSVGNETIVLRGFTPNLPSRLGLVVNPTKSHQNELFWNQRKHNYNGVPYWYDRAVFTKICDDPKAQQKSTPDELSKEMKFSSCFSPGFAKMFEEEKNAQLQQSEEKKNAKLEEFEEEKTETDMWFQNKTEIYTKKKIRNVDQQGALLKKLVGVEVPSFCLWNSDGIGTQGNVKAKTCRYSVSFCTEAYREDNDNKTLLELKRALALSRLLDKLEARLEQPQLEPEREPLLRQSAFQKTSEINELNSSKSTTSTENSQGLTSENEEE